MATSADLAGLLLARAADDEAAAGALLPVTNVTDSMVAFQAQQTAERALKAVLASRGIEFPFTHDLGALEELCRSSNIAIPGELAELDRLTPSAARARYEAPDPGTVDRVTALALASAALKGGRATVST
jgi:HEPN domain-containing protein